MKSKGKSKSDAPGSAGGDTETQPKGKVLTSNIRVIVTRNNRNAWVDELYEKPPEGADYPVFH